MAVTEVFKQKMRELALPGGPNSRLGSRFSTEDWPYWREALELEGWSIPRVV